mmetsp:Transcript_11659/g.35002  ORF Transcript_11659/g.35002 Transcript_11659/m.35002 type:complete len:373 (-) Transcript_11659:485-1603(-)
MCEPGAIHWIDIYLHDCVNGPRDIAGFTLGIVSICFWVVAQVPQFILNIKRESVEALSSWFLAQWLLGDTLNLVGCILTGSQLPTQTWTAGYFIFADMVMMIQYIYYMALQNQREKALARRLARQQRHIHYMHSRGSGDLDAGGSPLAHRHSDEEATLLGCGSGSSAGDGGAQGSSVVPAHGAPASKRSVATRLLAGIAVIFMVGTLTSGGASSAPVDGSSLSGLRRSLLFSRGPLASHPPAWAREAGAVMGWLSSVFYLLSRTSQLYKNWSRKCCEGLSMSMFLCAISANTSYGLGILLRTYSWEELRGSGPWLLGSLGVVILDILISLQGLKYPKEQEGRDYKRVREPLLVTRPAPAQAFTTLERDRRSL